MQWRPGRPSLPPLGWAAIPRQHAARPPVEIAFWAKNDPLKFEGALPGQANFYSQSNSRNAN